MLAGRYCVLGDDYARGVEEALASLKLDRHLGNRNHEPVPLILLGQIHQCHDDLERSSAYYSEALKLASELGEPQLLVPCYDGLGTIALFEGREAEAEDYLTESRKLLDGLGVPEDSMLVLPFLY